MSKTSAIETATETSLKDRLGPVNFGFSQYSVLCNTIGPDATHLLISLVDDRMAWNGDRMDVETIETVVTECLRDIFDPSFRFAAQTTSRVLNTSLKHPKRSLPPESTRSLARMVRPHSQLCRATRKRDAKPHGP
jgi:hypothetical protein